MRPSFYFCLLLLLPSLLRAQNNYVATSPTSATPARNNTLVGINTGNTTMTGSDNAFVGSQAGSTNTVGMQNVFIGSGAGGSNTSGSYSVFIGRSAGATNQDGISNTFTGYQAGQYNTSGGGTPSTVIRQAVTTQMVSLMYLWVARPVGPM